MIMRRIFGPKRDANGDWRRLHNEELQSLYCSPNIVRVINSRRLSWAGHVARIEEGRSAFKILSGSSTGRWPLGRSRRIWEGNIRYDHKEHDQHQQWTAVLQKESHHSTRFFRHQKRNNHLLIKQEGRRKYFFMKTMKVLQGAD